MNRKKIVATVLSIAMMIGCVPMSVGAEEIDSDQETIQETEAEAEEPEDPEEAETTEEPENSEAPDDETSTDDIVEIEESKAGTAPVYNDSNTSYISVSSWDDLKTAVGDNTDVKVLLENDITIPDGQYLFVTYNQTVVFDLNGKL